MASFWLSSFVFNNAMVLIFSNQGWRPPGNGSGAGYSRFVAREDSDGNEENVGGGHVCGL